MSINEIQKMALNNKKKKIDEKFKKDKETKMNIKEELILRILNDTKEVNAT